MEEINNTEEEFRLNQDTKEKGVQVFTERYSESAINRLKDLVVKMYHLGERKFYAILVDGEFVVKKNCDGRKFDRYLTFLSKETREVEVRMHQGKSFNHNKYIFVLKKGLTGLEDPETVQSQIDKALEEQRMENELADLKAQLAKKEKKLKKYKEKSQSGVDQIGKVVENGAKIVSYIKTLTANGNVLQGPTNQVKEEIEDSEIEIIESEDDSKSKKKNQKPKEIFNAIYQKVGEKGISDIINTMAILSANPEIDKMIKKELDKQNKNRE